MARVLVPPPERHVEQDELEALIREARARQRRRRLAGAAVVAVVAAAGLGAWAALPGRGGGSGGSPGPAATAGRGIAGAGRVPIVEVGSSGGVTWALNGLGMWLTTNGGRTWRASAPRHVRDMGDLMERVEQVDFLDRRHAWLFAVDVRGGLRPAWARHAELDRTSDGGRSWHWTFPQGCCGNVSFLDPRRGFFLGPSKLYSTTNGGRSWTAVARTPFRFGAATFVDARHGVAVTTGSGRLFSTSDGGKRWVSAHVPRREGVVANVAAFGERLVVPGDLAGSSWRLVVYVSPDGGATWQRRFGPKGPTAVRTSDPSEFSAASASVWYAVGSHTLAVTRDAGRSWRLVKVADLPPHWSIAAIDFTSPRVGWAVFQSYTPPAAPRSPASVLMRTADGGVHWTPAGPRKPKHGRR